MFSRELILLYKTCREIFYLLQYGIRNIRRPQWSHRPAGETIQAGAESPKERFHYQHTPTYGKKLFNRWENVTAYNIFAYEPWNIGSHNAKIHHMVHLARIIHDATMNGAVGVLVTGKLSAS
jgi:hypothetical protein